MTDVKLNYDDVTLVPEVISDICSRSECNPYDEEGYLPIFASCMSSVVSFENTGDFNAARIRTVIPRSYPIEERLAYLLNNEGNFVAFSLSEAREWFVDENSGNLFTKRAEQKKQTPLNICIDLANGHMSCLLELVKEIKEIWGEGIRIMTGNIANPETYRLYDEAGVDYVRCSIGTGNVCSTSSNVAVHYPVFSLLKEIYSIKQEINGKCKIIADGGIRGFRDIQKALIYADYVMIGSLFNKAIESAGKTTYGTFYWNIRGKKIARPIKTLLNYGKEVPKEDYEYVYHLVKNGKLTVWKENFGMSTKIAQSLINQANSIETKKLKTAEGLLKYQKVEFDIAGWAENETDYLRSAMSYTNSKTLDEYKNSQWVQILKIAYNQ
jgi:hypothetical protein